MRKSALRAREPILLVASGPNQSPASPEPESRRARVLPSRAWTRTRSVFEIRVQTRTRAHQEFKFRVQTRARQEFGSRVQTRARQLLKFQVHEFSVHNCVVLVNCLLTLNDWSHFRKRKIKICLSKKILIDLIW